MEDTVSTVAVLVVFAVCALFGAVTLAGGGFIRHTLGSLVIALLASLAFSAIARTLAAGLALVKPDLVAVVMVRNVIGALAQPTLSGIILLAIIVVVVAAAERMAGIAEDIHILLSCHEVKQYKPQPAKA